jgi:hypothetical protein
MLQMFHLDVSKVDRGVARRDRLLADSGLSLLQGQPTWVSPCGHRMGVSPTTDTHPVRLAEKTADADTDLL